MLRVKGATKAGKLSIRVRTPKRKSVGGATSPAKQRRDYAKERDAEPEAYAGIGFGDTGLTGES